MTRTRLFVVHKETDPLDCPTYYFDRDEAYSDLIKFVVKHDFDFVASIDVYESRDDTATRALVSCEWFRNWKNEIQEYIEANGLLKEDILANPSIVFDAIVMTPRRSGLRLRS